MTSLYPCTAGPAQVFSLVFFFEKGLGFGMSRYLEGQEDLVHGLKPTYEVPPDPPSKYFLKRELPGNRNRMGLWI